MQFLIDALDRAVDNETSGLEETEALIDRFPIDFTLDPGPTFTERTTYTGIYNLSTTIDVSFRIECSENYTGLDCCLKEDDSYCIENGTTSGDICTQCTSGRDPY